MENTNMTNNETKTTEDSKPTYDGCGCSNPNAFAQTMKEGFDKAFGTVKSCCIALLAILSIVIIGCKSIPTVDKMYATSNAVGTAAGMVANMTKIDDASRNTVIEIMTIAESCIPETNQTFYVAWMPIAEKHTQKLIDDKKIDEKQGELILGTFAVATKGIDYLFDVRYPQARQYQDLTEAAVHGFCGGFLTVFKPANGTMLLSAPAEETYDAEAYEYLKSVK